MRPVEEFKPGVYQHYRGGRYVALFLVRHHETGDPMVAYTCCERATTSVREWDSKGADSWCDWVDPESGQTTDEPHARNFVRRFQYVGPSVLP